MKTIKIGRFATLQFGSETCSRGSSASSVNNKEENEMFNKAKMSHAAEVNNKEENKMKQTLQEKRRFFKEVASMAREACKAGWAGEDFDLDDFIEENGFDTLLTDEERAAKVKAAEDASEAARKEKERKDFYDSLGSQSEPKGAEVETPPVKEEEESAVEETVVEETTEKEPEETPEVTKEAEATEEAEVTEEETPEVTEETEVTEEETPAGGKVRPVAVKVSKLFNYVGKFGSAGLRKVKGGYQWAKDKFSGFVAKTKEKTSEFVDKTNFRKNILWNTKMLAYGILGMYSGLILGIDAIYALGLLTMILSLRVVLPVVVVLALIELLVKSGKEEVDA